MSVEYPVFCHPCMYFSKVLLLPFSKFLGQNDQLLRYSFQKSYEKRVVSYFVILVQKWYKIAPRWVFANYPALHSGGVTKGRVLGRDSTAPKKAKPAYVYLCRIIHEVLYYMPKLKLYFFGFFLVSWFQL